MDAQKLLTIAIVIMAAIYLGRYLYGSLKEVFAKNAGCGGGCAKCAFANNSVDKGAGTSSGKQPSNLISLSDIQTLPSKSKTRG